MRIAENDAITNVQHAAQLPTDLQTVYELATMTAPALEAAIEEGKIQATTIDADGLVCRLAEIDENLIRNELTALERGEHMAERKDVYEKLYPTTRQGTAGALVSNRTRHGKVATNGSIPVAAPETFTQDTAKKVGVSRSVVEQDVKIARDIDEDLREKLRTTPVADRKVDLLKIALDGRRRHAMFLRQPFGGLQGITLIP